MKDRPLPGWVAKLAVQWRDTAATFRCYGVDGQATTFENCAKQLESEAAGHATEALRDRKSVV